MILWPKTEQSVLSSNTSYGISDTAIIPGEAGIPRYRVSMFAAVNEIVHKERIKTDIDLVVTLWFNIYRACHLG